MELPDIMPLGDYDGDWNVYCEALYGFYIDNISDAKLQVDSLPIWCRRHPPSQGKDFCFWHLVQEGPVEEDRVPDLNRCERLPWVPCIISGGRHEPDVRWWRNARHGKRNLLLWAWQDDHVVIMEIQRDRLSLVTSYGPLTRRRREAFETEWKAYCSNPW